MTPYQPNHRHEEAIKTLTKEEGRRSRLVIMGEIVGKVPPNNRGYDAVKKTHIMYRARLSFTQLEAYVKNAEKIGLLEKINDGYVRTEKGNSFISLLYEIANIFNQNP